VARKVVKSAESAIDVNPEQKARVAALLTKIRDLQKRRKGDHSNVVKRVKTAEWLSDHRFLIGLIDPVADALSPAVGERYEMVRDRVLDVQDNHEYSASSKNPENVQWFPIGTYIEEVYFLIAVTQGTAERFLEEERADLEAVAGEKTASQRTLELRLANAAAG
jgi:hypothetical protein